MAKLGGVGSGEKMVNIDYQGQAAVTCTPHRRVRTSVVGPDGTTGPHDCRFGWS